MNRNRIFAALVGIGAFAALSSPLYAANPSAPGDVGVMVAGSAPNFLPIWRWVTPGANKLFASDGAGAVSFINKSTFESAITAGTSAQYWRGDKSWQTLNSTAVGLGNVENTALSSWTGSANISTVGTIASGTWHGSPIGGLYGGTGRTDYGGLGQIFIGGSLTELGTLAGNSTTTKKFLTSTGNGTFASAPAWGTISSGDVSGLGSLATLSAAPAGTLTGSALAGGITSAPGLVTAAGGTFGTAAFTASTIYQQVDADLTSIAALSTTSFGRSVLTQSDAASLRTLQGLGSLATASTVTSAQVSDASQGGQGGGDSGKLAEYNAGGALASSGMFRIWDNPSGEVFAITTDSLLAGGSVGVNAPTGYAGGTTLALTSQGDGSIYSVDIQDLGNAATLDAGGAATELLYWTGAPSIFDTIVTSNGDSCSRLTAGVDVLSALEQDIGSASGLVLTSGDIAGNAGTATAALGIKSATTTVAVSAATAPTTGQVLTATSGTAATWQTPSGSTYTAGTGLTLTGSAFAIGSTVATLTGTQTLTNKTLTTPTIGQINGNTTASGTLTLQSTTNGTKGKILFGTSAYDEVNNRFGVGITTPLLPFHLVASNNAAGLLRLQNSAAGGYSGVELYGDGGTQLAGFGVGCSASGFFTGEMYLGTNTSKGIYFYTSSAAGVRMMVSAAGGVSIGNTTDAGAGNLSVTGTITTASSINMPKTITADATTGAQTINKPSGSINFAAAATSLVVTNSLVTANSVIILTVAANDTTCKSCAVVAGAGSFTIYPNAAPTAETRVNFIITN